MCRPDQKDDRGSGSWRYAPAFASGRQEANEMGQAGSRHDSIAQSAE
jgi:hypothetical protein